MDIINQNKRLVSIMAVALGILCIPLIAMNFSNEVNWTLFDFIVVGLLLLGTGFALEFMLRHIKTLKYRLILGAAIIIILLMVWVELAVGIFGTPFAGS